MTTPPAASGPGGRRLRERARRCDEVLAVARRLFTTKGYQGTTMAEIAAASELALGTLYQLFPSKDEMLCRLLEDHVDDVIARARAEAAAGGSAREQIGRIVRTQLALLQDRADLLGLYLAGLIGYDTSLRHSFGPRLDARYGAYLDMLSAVMRRGIRDGTLAARPPRRLAMALAGMISALVREWLKERRGRLADAADDLLDLFLSGASPRGTEGRR